MGGGAVVVWIGVFGLLVQRGSPEDERRLLAVRVESRESVPLTEMLVAQREAERIFHTGDVPLMWTKPGEEAPATQLTIRVVWGPSADQMVPRSDRGLTRLAIALPAARRAYVHYPRVVAVAQQWHVDPGTLLGRVLAHELVHILLRAHDHTNSGLMAAEMDPRGAKPPRLTITEVEGIHNALSQSADARGALRR